MRRRQQQQGSSRALIGRLLQGVSRALPWPRGRRRPETETPEVAVTMATEVEAHKLLVRRCVDDLKKLDGSSRYQVATFIPPMQKLGDLNDKVRRLPKSLSEDVADVMAQQGAAELLAQALTSLSDKDSPVPDANFRPINATVSVLLRYTDYSPALGRAVGQCGTIKHLLDILKHQPLWERSKTEPATCDAFLLQSITEAAKLLSLASHNSHRVADSLTAESVSTTLFCSRQKSASGSLKVPSCATVKKQADAFDGQTSRPAAIMRVSLSSHRLEHVAQIRLAIRRLLVNTVSLLGNLSREPENRACFRQSNAVPVMQELLKNDKEEVRSAALQVIAHVLEESDCDPPGRDEFTVAPRGFRAASSRQIYEAGAVAPLVQSLRQGRSAEKLHAVTTLSRLSRDPRHLLPDEAGSCSAPVKGFISCCSSSRSTEVQARLAGVPKWQEGDVQAWLEESSLGAYCPNFTQIDGRILHSLLEIRQQAPEFFAMVAREVGGFHRLEDFLKFLDAVEKLH
ncbi:unnamed protein product [Lampetra planeri]